MPRPFGAAPLPASPSAESEFRASLLLVLALDLVVLLVWLGWSRRASASAGLFVVALAVPLAIMLIVRPSLRRVVVLLARCEARRMSVVAPVAAAFVFSSLALGLGGDARAMPVDSAVRHLGPVDELIVTTDAGSRNQAVDAITRARDTDPRVGSTIDDLLSLVAVDASLTIGDRRFAVTAVELDVPLAVGFGKVPAETGLVDMAPLVVGDIAVAPSVLAGTGPGPVAVRLSVGDEAIDVRARALPVARGFGSFDLEGLGRPRLGQKTTTPVVYVAPGTISTAVDKLADGGASRNVRFLVAVSNLGDARHGLRRTAAATTLLESILSSPPAGPVAVPADDPLGLGGPAIAVAAPVNATVIAVKSAHVLRVRGEFDAAAMSRRVARGALFTAALAVMGCAYVARRRINADRARALRTIGLRRRRGFALNSAVLGSGVGPGLVLGAIGGVLVPLATGRIGGGALFPGWGTLARAVSLTCLAAVVPLVGAVAFGAVPRRLRSRLSGVGSARPPMALRAVGGLGLAVVGIVIGRGRSSELRIGLGIVLTVFGLCAALGATVLTRRPFGMQTSARPVRRSRTRSFAGVCAATGLAVLPVAASQGLQATTAPTGGAAWRSVVRVDDEADAVGLLRQLAGPTNGRVLQRATVLVAGDGTEPAELAVPAIALAAADGLGDGWVPRMSGVRVSSVDLEPGAAVVSRRLAAIRDFAVGDTAVLVDPLTTRSSRVTVAGIASFPAWAGDLALPADAFIGLRTLERTTVARSAVALSVRSPTEARAAMSALSSTAVATVGGADASVDGSVGSAFGRWLRRVALVTVALFVAVALALRTGTWRRVRWTVVVVAAAVGLVLGLVLGGSRIMSPIGPLLMAAFLGLLCVVSAMHLLTEPVRVRDVARALPRPTRPDRDHGEFD